MIYVHHTIAKITSIFLLILLLYSCEEILFETDISQEQVTLLAPQDGTELNFTSINFNWSSVQEARGYNFQLASPNFENANQIIEDIVVDSITQFSTTLSINEYEWRVRAINDSYQTQYSAAKFSVISNEYFQDNVITILTPSENVISNTLETQFEWSAIQDATGYRVQILNNVDGSVTEEMLSSETSFWFTFEDGDYTFQVRAEKDDEVTVYASRTILIDTVLPNTPTLTAPIDMAVLTDDTIMFTWTREAVEGASEFDTISIYSDQGLTMLVQEEIASSPFETSLENGTYFWTVQAIDEAGNEGEISSTFSFTKN
ncbi:hypothetical protein N9960_01925 [Flavobacteriaceae bacterium]|nr:hypothetical protein [Flavobacteriaceae bacterium]